MGSGPEVTAGCSGSVPAASAPIGPTVPTECSSGSAALKGIPVSSANDAFKISETAPFSKLGCEYECQKNALCTKYSYGQSAKNCILYTISITGSYDDTQTDYCTYTPSVTQYNPPACISDITALQGTPKSPENDQFMIGYSNQLTKDACKQICKNNADCFEYSYNTYIDSATKNCKIYREGITGYYGPGGSGQCSYSYNIDPGFPLVSSPLSLQTTQDSSSTYDIVINEFTTRKIGTTISSYQIVSLPTGVTQASCSSPAYSIVCRTFTVSRNTIQTFSIEFLVIDSEGNTLISDPIIYEVIPACASQVLSATKQLIDFQFPKSLEGSGGFSSFVIEDTNLVASLASYCPIQSYTFQEITTSHQGLYQTGCPSPTDTSLNCRTIFFPTNTARFQGTSIPPFEYTMTIVALGEVSLTLTGFIQITCSSSVKIFTPILISHSSTTFTADSTKARYIIEPFSTDDMNCPVKDYRLTSATGIVQKQNCSETSCSCESQDCRTFDFDTSNVTNYVLNISIEAEGGAEHFQSVNIKIIGNETCVQTTQPRIAYVFEKNKTNQVVNFTKFFLSNCTIESFELFKDRHHIEVWSQDSIILQKSELPQSAFIYVIATKAIDQTLFIFAKAHRLYQNEIIQIEIIVCGLEEIAPMSRKVQKYLLIVDQREVKIPNAEKKFFKFKEKSGGKRCYNPKLEFFEDKSLQRELDKANNFLSIVNSNMIEIKTHSVQAQKNYYLVQQTKGGKQAYVQFQIEIIEKELSFKITNQDHVQQNKSQSVSKDYNQIQKDLKQDIKIEDFEKKKDSNQLQNKDWKITKTDGLGRVFINFSHFMNYNYSRPFMNSTYVDIHIKPFIGDYDITNTSRNLNIQSWKLLSFEEGLLQLQLQFESPLNVSLNFIYDNLVIQILNQTRIFKTIKGEIINQFRDEIQIQKQMIQNDLSFSMVITAESSVKFLKGLIINQGFSTIFISKAMAYFMKMINPLQIIFHLPALNFGLPSNIMEFFSIIVPIVNYDVLESFQPYQDFLVSISGEKEDIWADKKRCLAQSGFSFEPEDQSQPKIPSQLQSIGYESHSPIKSMGTVTLTFIIYIIRVIFVFVLLWPLSKCKFKRFRRFFKRQLKAPYFRSIITVVFEVYLELMVIGLISLYTPRGNKDFNAQTFVVGVFLLNLTFLVIPTIMVYVLSKPQNVLEKVGFRNNWGSIYMDYKSNSKVGQCYRVVYCLRRIVFASCIIIFDKVPAFQLIFLLYSNLLMTFYVSNRPFKDLISNRIEMLNEYMVSSIFYIGIVITDYQPDITIRYKGAWILIAAVSLVMIFNIVIVIWFLLHDLKLTIKKYYRRIKQKYDIYSFSYALIKQKYLKALKIQKKVSLSQSPKPRRQKAQEIKKTEHKLNPLEIQKTKMSIQEYKQSPSLHKSSKKVETSVKHQNQHHINKDRRAPVEITKPKKSQRKNKKQQSDSEPRKKLVTTSAWFENNSRMCKEERARKLAMEKPRAAPPLSSFGRMQKFKTSDPRHIDEILYDLDVKEGRIQPKPEIQQKILNSKYDYKYSKDFNNKDPQSYNLRQFGYFQDEIDDSRSVPGIKFWDD